jgi:glycerophosphoryl diester phosphodiesterase
MMTEMPILVAHRGVARHYPENTLPALDAAAAAGARWVEVDVQLCADEVAVLMHDADLTRVADQPVSLFSLSAAALASIPVGEPARFGQRFGEVRAPTLAEFAAWLIARPEISAFVELKWQSIERFGRHAVVQACMAAMSPARGRWLPISTDYEALALAADAGAEALGWVVRDFDPAVAERARALPARWLFCNHLRLPPGPLPRGPWEWVIYEVADIALAHELIGRGARWLETMAYPELRAGLTQSAPV